MVGALRGERPCGTWVQMDSHALLLGRGNTQLQASHRVPHAVPNSFFLCSHHPCCSSTDLDLETPPWPSVSRHAKDLVRRMLQVGRRVGESRNGSILLGLRVPRVPPLL